MEFTVILPTTDDRWPLVRLALDCIRRQTVDELEIFLIGDGVAEASHAKYEEWAKSDERLRYFAFPKHERRGEPYRDALLRNEARGRCIAYCCDRDLWFPHHLATLREGLRSAEFAHTLVMDVRPDGSITGRGYGDLSQPEHRTGLANDLGATYTTPLSTWGHTLTAYKALSEGWATTPGRIVTDTNMAKKWMRDPSARVTTLLRPTVLYFHRGGHPGWPVAQRREELERWHPKTLDREGYLECLEAYSVAISRERVEWFHRARRLEKRAHPLRSLARMAINGLLRIDLATGRTLSLRFPRLRKLARAMR